MMNMPNSREEEYLSARYQACLLIMQMSVGSNIEKSACNGWTDFAVLQRVAVTCMDIIYSTGEEKRELPWCKRLPPNGLDDFTLVIGDIVWL